MITSKEAKCHRLEVDISPSGYTVNVLDSRGMSYQGSQLMFHNGTNDKLDFHRHSYVCDKCGEVIQFDVARATV